MLLSSRRPTTLAALVLVAFAGFGRPAAAVPGVLTPPGYNPSVPLWQPDLVPAPPGTALDGSPGGDAALFARLQEADRAWLPQVRSLPGGRQLITVRRLRGDPPLTPEKARALLLDPPSFERERLAIAQLLGHLRGLGVRVALAAPRQSGAAGEWIPRHATLRIRPDIPSRGSRAFALVLNHEALHVAQSCRGGGVRSIPVPLGLPLRLGPQERELLGSPVYARVPARVRHLEEEAFAHQHDLALGVALLERSCGPAPAPASPGRLAR